MAENLSHDGKLWNDEDEEDDEKMSHQNLKQTCGSLKAEDAALVLQSGV